MMHNERLEMFLYQGMDILMHNGVLSGEIPDSVLRNLNPEYQLRLYQKGALERFFHYYDHGFSGKRLPHLLFNMATGSGKTLIMAGAMLYLYTKGYRNFLFFVDSLNIIDKTKENFLNPDSGKYLFNKDVMIDNRRVRAVSVESFDAVNPDDINIHFTTIQGLHANLTMERENAVNYSDFRQRNIALIADEAHHMSAATRQQLELGEKTWENTVQKILEQSSGNILLEFTATHDYINPGMREKYQDKVIVRYDLRQFRNDKFSKEVVIAQSDFEQKYRILQALILSQYRQEVAAKCRINLKPVILFKAQRTIAQSEKVRAEFDRLIDGLNVADMAEVRRSQVPVIKRAFRFFGKNKVSDGQLAKRIKDAFQPDFCLSANDEKTVSKRQLLLNSLEQKNNPIRAIFAVQKLNEGWDVLNLFDIVRCYETRDARGGQPGATTNAEAQLIGRGARYFPFVLPDNKDRYCRKFDGDTDNELRVLEEMHYHSVNDHRYIAEIRKALVGQGILDEKEITYQLKLKEQFKKTDFYKVGVIWTNKCIPRKYQNVWSFADLGVAKANYEHAIASGVGSETVIMERNGGSIVNGERHRDVQVTKIPRNVVESALAQNAFFAFDQIKRYFPNLSSMRDFAKSEAYLGGLEITFKGDLSRIESPSEQIAAMRGVLDAVAKDLHKQDTVYEGTKIFEPKEVGEVFVDKDLKFSEGNPRGEHDEQFLAFVSDKSWFAFDNLYGTEEEKAFVRLLDREMPNLKTQYNDIYLLRNEKHFAVYNFADGRRFEPDFILFLRSKIKKLQMYQIFLEPKGEHLQEHDRWKEEFLCEITKIYDSKTLRVGNKQYWLIGLPFYNHEDENKFREQFRSVLEEKSGARK